MFGIEVEIGLLSLSLIPMLKIMQSGCAIVWFSSFPRRCVMCVVLAPGNDSIWTSCVEEVVIRDRFESPRIRILVLVLFMFQTVLLCNVVSCLIKSAAKSLGC